MFYSFLVPAIRPKQLVSISNLPMLPIYQLPLWPLKDLKLVPGQTLQMSICNKLCHLVFCACPNSFPQGYWNINVKKLKASEEKYISDDLFEYKGTTPIYTID